MTYAQILIKIREQRLSEEARTNCLRQLVAERRFQAGRSAS